MDKNMDQQRVLEKLKEDVATAETAIDNMRRLLMVESRINWRRVNQELVTFTALARDVRDGVMQHNHGRILTSNEAS